MRGKVLIINNLVSEVGITPAYAGKRYSTDVLSPEYRDHPRVCGEK